MNYYTLDSSNNIIPSSFDNYIKWDIQNQDRRIISRNRLFIRDEEIFISTVFLGLDHRYDYGEPLVFETMIFGGINDGWQERYTNYKAACEGHIKTLLKVMNNEELTYS